MTTTRPRPALAGAAVLLLVLVACDDLVEDFNFERWCGESLCDWELEYGSYERVGTWHASDYGVSFVDDPTAISQLVAASDVTAPCMRFEVVSSVSTDAELRLELDFDDDGTVDVERTLERASWERSVFYVTPPTSFQWMRLRAAKYGSGAAILATLRVQGASPADGCVGPPAP